MWGTAAQSIIGLRDRRLLQSHTKHFQGRSAVKTPIITDDSATRRRPSVRVSAQGDRSFNHQGHALEVVASTGLVWAYLCHSFPSSNSSSSLFIPTLTSANQFLCNFLQLNNSPSLVDGSENILSPENSPLSNNLKYYAAPSALHLTPRRVPAGRHGSPKEGIDVCPLHVSSHVRLFLSSTWLLILTRLHLGGKYSDLTVKCNSREYNVHRAILCSRSGFFDGACSNQFREAQTGLIDLSEEDEEAVEHMIHCKSLSTRILRPGPRCW